MAVRDAEPESNEWQHVADGFSVDRRNQTLPIVNRRGRRRDANRSERRRLAERSDRAVAMNHETENKMVPTMDHKVVFMIEQNNGSHHLHG